MKAWRAMGRGRVVLAVWVLYGISALVMFGWPGLTGAVSRACHGRSALDVRSHWTAADARDLVAACGTEGRAAYLRLELLDFVYPLLCGLALLLVSSLLIRRLPGRRWRLLLIPAIAMKPSEIRILEGSAKKPRIFARMKNTGSPVMPGLVPGIPLRRAQTVRPLSGWPGQARP